MNIRAALFILFLVMAQVLAACGAGGLSAATSIPMAIPTPTNDPLQSAKIVQAFWDALEAGDLETAIAYIDDKASCSGYCYFSGKTAFRSYLQGYLEAGHVTEISDLKSVGSIVTYSWSVYRNGNLVQRGDSNEIMQVEDGKIVYWENQHR